MLTLVGRNDPCPCGSGKKYKKCHGKNNSTSDISAVIESEVARLQGLFAQDYYSKVNHKLQTRLQEWHAALQHAPHLPEGYLEIAAVDTAMYVDEPTEWKEYIETVVADEEVRAQVKAVFKEWAEPTLVLAEVVSNDENLLQLKDVTTGASYAMPSSPNAATAKWVFGVVFKDTRVAENGIQVSQSTLFIPETLSMVTDIMKAKLANGVTDALELYKAFVEILENEVEETETKEVSETPAPKKTTISKVEKVEAKEGETFEDEIIGLVKAYLTEFNLEAADFVTSVESYLANTNIKAKKAGAVAAGAILAGQTAGVVPEGGLSKVKDVAEHFDVSSSSLSKYRKEIAETLEK
ncbi:YecA family protein [Kurthia senegalensis]|uniref:YecA family protein n=1 Tax=Kurthia senegalensis TaxID=1033740 RepID=UPI001F28FACC|nr:SEC-C metal-binding domain-containing protein [Kurthia senegalensis]